MKVALLALLGLFSYITALSNDSAFYRRVGPPDDVPETNSEMRRFKQADKQLKEYHVSAVQSNEFSEAYFNKYYEVTGKKIDEKRQEAANCTSLVEKESDKRVIDLISPDKLVHLPVGMVKKIGSGNEKVTIAISRARFTPEYTELTVYCKVELPNAKKVLFLGADNIKLSRTGSFIGDAYIKLLGDFPINTRDSSMVVVFKGGMDMKTGEVQSATFARLDCSGIKEVNIAGEVLFSRNTFMPLTDYLKPVTDKSVKVKSTFNVTGRSFSDIVVDISFPSPFTITKLQNNVAFKVEQAIWDFSDTRTPADVVFPKGYGNLLDKPELWKGIFIKEIKVWAVPKEFAVTTADKETNTPESSSFVGSNVIIDRAGLTGDFSFNNSAGNARLQRREILGCKFSIEKLFLKIESNTLKGGGFAGRISLPVQQVKDNEALDSNNSMGYDVLIVPGNKYTFRITEKGEFDMGVWQARATVETDSYVEVYKNANKWRLKVVLNGSMGVEIKKEEAGEASNADQKASASFKGIQFQELVIQNKAPYFQVKYLGYTGTIQLDQFPNLSLSDIFVTVQNSEVALGLKVNVSLLDNKISGNAKVMIVGNVKNGSIKIDALSESFKPEFSFKRFKVEAMKLAAEFGVVSVGGQVIRHKGDSVMGTGWEGALALDIKLSEAKTIKVDARGAFGKKEKQGGGSFSYFYIDGMAYGFEVPLGGSFKAVAFGGGLSWGMYRKASIYEDSTSVSGTKYVPDEKYGLALKAVMGIEDISSTSMKGEACLDIVFTRAWGIANIGFSGKAYFFPDKYFKGLNDAVAVVKKGKDIVEKAERIADKLETLRKNGKFLEVARTMYDVRDEVRPALQEQREEHGGKEPGKITALVGISMDFENKCLHGNLDIYVDIDLELLKIKGRWANNLAGQGVLYTDFRKESYIHLGTPQQKMGIKVEVPGLFNVTTGNYFMVGTSMPDPQQPPSIVANILGTELYQLKNTRNPNVLRRGLGYAMGFEAGLEAKAGEEKGQAKRALEVYVDLVAGFGVDYMARFLGEAYCTSGERISAALNGFQATGNAYLYIKGKCGVKLNIFGVQKNIPVVAGTGALLAQAQGPDPFYFKGGIVLDVSVLGLPIAKIPRINLTVGRYCEIANPVPDGPLAGINMIADVSPKCENKGTAPGADPGTGSGACAKTDVFTTPEVAFNMPVEQAFPLSDDNGVKQYYIRLRKFDLLQNGQRVALKDTFFHSDNTGLNYETTDILPPNSPLQFIVEVGLEEWVDGRWQPVYQNGQMVVERREVVFTTGDAPSVIPKENIAFMYPVKDQKYFYPQEYNEAYIQLKKGQTYLFKEHPELLEAQFKAADGSFEKANFTYDSIAQRVVVQLPVLENRQKYTYSLVRLPETAEKENITTETRVIGEGEDAVEITEKKIEGEVKQEVEHDFLTYEFNTSKYNTFAEKMRAKRVERSLYEIIQSDVGALQAEVSSGNEGFDMAELKGAEETNGQPLIQAQALLTDDYYLLDIKRLLYDTARYAPYGIKVSRDTAKVGFPPARGLDVLPWYTNAVMSNPQYQLLETRAPIRYNVVAYYKEDFSSIQLQAVNKYVREPNGFPGALIQYIENGFPLMRNGVYEAVFKYVLPGGITRSSHTVRYTNTIK